MLGALLAVLSAASFAATNAAARRGVVTGTPAQGMVLTNPVGVICFSVVAIATGKLTWLGEFPLPAAAWMAGVGVLHFICGRYANFRANQSAGTNLTAPVMQLNSIVTLVLAVVLLGEPCTMLKIIGGITMISGALVAQRQVPVSISAGPLRFSPRKAEGCLFAALAALAYGTTPIMTRTALQSAGPSGAIIGGLIAYGAATVVVVIMLLSSAVLRHNLMLLKQESVRWFVYSGVFVAVAQGFLYSAVSVAPIMLVMPLLQLSLVFRLFFSTWLNPEHEVFGPRVIVGCVISLAGASTVAVDTEFILHALAIPHEVARALAWRI